MPTMTPKKITIKRALISVADKAAVISLAKHLADLKIEILSTGGTAALLKEHDVPVLEVSDYTGFHEIMDGRVKTLHPKIHGGLLGRENQDEDSMRWLGIKPIDLLVVNLYPFQETIAKSDCQLSDAIEQIDIGGPAMIRSGAKNFNRVTVVTQPEDYDELLDALKQQANTITYEQRFSYAKKAFAYTAQYDMTIANYLASLPERDTTFPQLLNLRFTLRQALRYGENPHQKAAFYQESEQPAGSITSAELLRGKPLSFNNIVDADTALECVKQFRLPSCVIVKHATPCGVASASSLLEAYQRAYKTDPVSAFGGVIAFNCPFNEALARHIIKRQFVELIIAPVFDKKSFEIFKEKPNVRLVAYGKWPKNYEKQKHLDYKRVQGGLLVQETDNMAIDKHSERMKVVTERSPSEKEWQDLLFAMKLVKFVKSNAIVYAKDQASLGIGAGQMSRVFSVQIAAEKAKQADLSLCNAVMASDAFFPFKDGILVAAEKGVSAIIQPGGSMRDEEVIQASNEAGLAMVFTGIRHFRH